MGRAPGEEIWSMPGSRELWNLGGFLSSSADAAGLILGLCRQGGEEKWRIR